MSQIWPGATIGIIGGGQLARMLTLEARRMGYHVGVLDPDPDGPAAQVSSFHVEAAFEDAAAAERLAGQCDVVTFDTEHVPSETIAEIEKLKPLRPSACVLRTIQDRLAQRSFLTAQRAPQARHAPVANFESLRSAAAAIGFPSILKARRSGYDGKGQARVDRIDALADAWRAVDESPSVLESFVEFEREISVLLARDLDGNIRFHPIAENLHLGHILRTTRVPARISVDLAARAEALGARIASALGYVGMMAIEMFVTRDEEILVNEIAPRTHNSGHYSFGACATSQFEQHVRAICGLPLGDPTLLRPSVMLNLLGDLWADGPPHWSAVLSQPGARLHLYGKRRPLPGRKMGHVLISNDDIERAVEISARIAAGLAHGLPSLPRQQRA